MKVSVVDFVNKVVVTDTLPRSILRCTFSKCVDFEMIKMPADESAPNVRFYTVNSLDQIIVAAHILALIYLVTIPTDFT